MKILPQLLFLVLCASCLKQKQIVLQNAKHISNASTTKVHPVYFEVDRGGTLEITGTNLNTVKAVTLNGDFGERRCSNLIHHGSGEITCQVSGVASIGSESISLVGEDGDVSANVAKIGHGVLLGESSASENTAIRRGFIGAEGVHLVGDKIMVSGRDRLLVWSSFPSASGTQPDVVIGKADPRLADDEAFSSNPSAKRMSFHSAFSDGTRLFVVSKIMAHSRVLIWNSMPTGDESPHVVLGQSGLSGSGANNGGVSASTLNAPSHVFYDGTRLYVADNSNHRVLIWNSLPTTNGQPADVVLGQPDFTSLTMNNGGLSASTMRNPRYVLVKDGKLLVVDGGNNRVLIWNSIPTTNGQPADVVVGQASMTTSNSGTSASDFNQPYAITEFGSGFAVSDTNNFRILVFNTIPGADYPAADLVLGQPDFITAVKNNQADLGKGMSNRVRGMSSSGGKLCYSDLANSRVACYSSLPTVNNQAADIVLGQSSFSKNQQYSEGAIAADTVAWPNSCGSEGEQNFVVSDGGDPGVGRVLVWDQLPTTRGELPNTVIGQPDFVSGGSFWSTPNAGTAKYARQSIVRNNKLIVSDDQSHRLLVYNLPLSDGQSADFVLGQPDMVTGTANTGGRGANTFNRPINFDFDGTRLFVADLANNRVLVWNSLTGANQQPADLVLGQATMTSATGGTGPSSMSFPHAVHYDGTRLYVGDYNNNRVLIWNSLPSTDGQPADLVLGQPDFSSNSENLGNVSAKTLFHPTCIFTKDEKLYICDRGNNRLLVWDEIPTENQQPASRVIGKNSFSERERELLGDDSLLDNFDAGAAAAVGDNICLAGSSKVVIVPVLD